MFFNRIEKLSGDTYAVSGYSEVKENPCDFSGTIKIEQVREYKTLHIGISGEAQSEGIVSQGIVIGKYEFNENKNQKYSGTFSGIMTANWYKNSDGLIKYDDINYYSDGYRNNQYIGTWQMYGSHKKKTANWGEYRIPFSNQLDIGTSEFKANPTYSKEGW